jgi:sortase (surface protein transpeptidase)
VAVGLIALGVGLALVVAVVVAVGDRSAAQAQRAAAADLDRTWRDGVDPLYAAAATAAGTPLARLRIPALGPDGTSVLLEGTDDAVLARGPGHYTGTPFPGALGNAALAGHRVSRGAPFEGLGELTSCDAIVVETRDTVLTYRVLPFDGEVQGWAEGKGSTPACAGVDVPTGDYAGLVGRQIVTPDRVDVLAPVPGRPGLQPSEPLRLLTLTTCHPRFSARERMVIHAVLVDASPTPAGT